jgi:hypothetical protein
MAPTARNDRQRAGILFVGVSAAVVAGCLFHVRPVAAQSNAVADLSRSLERIRQGEVRIDATVVVLSTMGTTSSIDQVRPKTAPETSQIVYRGSGSQSFLSHLYCAGSTFRIQSDYVLREDGELLTIQAPLSANLQQDLNDNSISVVLRSPRLTPTTPPSDRGTLMAMIHDRGFPLGFLDGLDVADYFGEPESTPSVMEGSLVRVSAKTDNGEIILLLDPLYGHLPREVRLVKRGRDKTGNRRVDEIEMAGDGSRWPAGKVSQLVWRAERIELDRRDDTPYIRRAVVHADTVSAAGPVVRLTTRAEVTGLDLGVSFRDEQLTSTLKTPEHYRVTIEGAPHLPYEFQGGEVVPRVIGAAALARGGDSGIPYLIIGINVLIVAYLAYRLAARVRET